MFGSGYNPHRAAGYAKAAAEAAAKTFGDRVKYLPQGEAGKQLLELCTKNGEFVEEINQALFGSRYISKPEEVADEVSAVDNEAVMAEAQALSDKTEELLIESYDAHKDDFAEIISECEEAISKIVSLRSSNGAIFRDLLGPLQIATKNFEKIKKEEAIAIEESYLA